MSVVGLTATPLFEGCSPAALDSFAARLEPRQLAAGAALMREGDDGRFFALIASGQVAVTRTGPRGVEHLARAGTGSILGELALLRGRPRGATVTAAVPTVAMTGDADAFERLLELPGVHERIRRLVSARLAQDVRPVPVDLPDGSPLMLRPLLPSDRDGVAAALRGMSPESLRRRFFSGGQPSERVIDYLVAIDYTDHFAWLAIEAGASGEGLATARYIRQADAPESAELAFSVKDAHQGRGIGSLLLGAIAAAASVSGIDRFTASLLADNTPMRSVLSKAAATFAFDEPGVTSARLTVDDSLALLEHQPRTALQSAARDIVTAAGLALTHPTTRR